MPPFKGAQARYSPRLLSLWNDVSWYDERNEQLAGCVHKAVPHQLRWTTAGMRQRLSDRVMLYIRGRVVADSRVPTRHGSVGKQGQARANGSRLRIRDRGRGCEPWCLAPKKIYR